MGIHACNGIYIFVSKYGVYTCHLYTDTYVINTILATLSSCEKQHTSSLRSRLTEFKYPPLHDIKTHDRGGTCH